MCVCRYCSTVLIDQFGHYRRRGKEQTEGRMTPREARLCSWTYSARCGGMGKPAAVGNYRRCGLAHRICTRLLLPMLEIFSRILTWHVFAHSGQPFAKGAIDVVNKLDNALFFQHQGAEPPGAAAAGTGGEHRQQRYAELQGTRYRFRVGAEGCRCWPRRCRAGNGANFGGASPGVERRGTVAIALPRRETGVD